MPRVQPIPPREWPAGMAQALAAAYRPTNPRHPPSPLDPESPKGLNAMGVLAYHPELTAAYNNLISHALYFTTITTRQRELLILRVAHLRQSPYEWAQHVYQAGVVGITRRGDRAGSRRSPGRGLERARIGLVGCGGRARGRRPHR